MRKKREEHVNHERWLVSYADFITLMFAFFVILYATSKADAEKFKKVADALSNAFGAKIDSNTSDSKSIEQSDSKNSIGGNEEFKRLALGLEDIFGFEPGLASNTDKMQMHEDERGLVVRLSAADFFVPNAAFVKEELLPTLDKIVMVLKKTDKIIRIEGHTDNTRVVNELYPTNWELSTARASWVVRYMIERHQFNPTQLEAMGLAEYRPIANNDTPAGQAKNRRVEIIVLNKDNL